MNYRALIIDDEKDICFLISEILNDENFTTEVALNSSEALKKFESFKPDLIILDVWLGNSDLDGIELLKEFKQINLTIPIIIISGHGTVDMAVQAIKNGAYDFLEKPFNSEKILITSKRAIESAELIYENENLKKIVNPIIPIIGNSNFIRSIKKNIDKYSSSQSRILISGPKGSGKKLIAQNIHKLSSKSKSLADIIDFKNLDESDLFNMFQDQSNMIKHNLLYISNNKTLILNNIDILPLNFQKKLLFFLENKQFFETMKINLNIKIIATTNKDLIEEIKKGNFLDGLYERLKVINIHVPPIKDRREDIIPICEFYLDYFNLNKKFKFFLSKKSSNKLEAYEWPGNVRQIINYIEKTIIFNQEYNNNSDYELDNLPTDMGEIDENINISSHFSLSLKEARQNFEKEYLLSQIERFNGNISKISEFTGMERTALYRKFKSLNILLDNKK